MPEEPPAEEHFLAVVEAVRKRDESLSPLTAGIVAAIALGIARDSRTFAKLFGIEHALVLRAINEISGPDAPIETVRRDARTQRTHLQLTVKGEALAARALDLPREIAK